VIYPWQLLADLAECLYPDDDEHSSSSRLAVEVVQKTRTAVQHFPLLEAWEKVCALWLTEDEFAFVPRALLPAVLRLVRQELSERFPGDAKPWAWEHDVPEEVLM